MKVTDRYELHIGIETHVELDTRSKLFCRCRSVFAAEPNTVCCPVCTGMPGTLPALNRKAVELAVKAGAALGCNINRVSRMERKNYHYPDLPKGYQISQNDMPICSCGSFELFSGSKIRIERIQLEEDAGKLIHAEGKTYVDYNRCGVPLIEIVSAPDICSSAQAAEYITQLQILLRSLKISDCRMQEASMRFDVNISLSGKGEGPGTRVELKNMNSVSFMEKAIDYEAGRQRSLLDSGKQVKRETRRYDSKNGITEVLRIKEKETDYGFFYEPDIPYICMEDTDTERIINSLPELPCSKFRRYTTEYGIDPEKAELILKYSKVAEFFESSVKDIKCIRYAASVIYGQIFSILKTEKEKEEFCLPFTAQQFNRLIGLYEENKITKSALSSAVKECFEGNDLKTVLEKLSDKAPDREKMIELCTNAVKDNPKAVRDYLNGKTKAISVLIGSVMKSTKGTADAAETSAVIKNIISEGKYQL